MFEIVADEAELMRELNELANYWPWSIEDLRAGQAYPPIATLSSRCTVIVAGDNRIH